MAERPTGAVTFLLTDVEGSTQAWEQTPTEMDQALEIHDQILREAIESHRGYVFATGGDSFSAAFSSPTSALTAAAEAQRGLVDSGCGLKVRIGVHSGEAIERDGNYFGPALNRTARLMSIGHGGQVLVSATSRELVASGSFVFVDLGEHRLADLSTPTRVLQLVADGLDRDFPALRSVVATDNLPRLGEVFARDSDIEQVAALLGEHRLVTLTGAGGIGKTTLATSVANQMVDRFPDGRWMVDLTDLPVNSDGTAISGAVAGVDERFASVEALAPRQMLLVLDNCEHVLVGARNYLDDLLDIAPAVTVLATSREPVGLHQEWVMAVQPLTVVEDSAHASAADLFVERAARTGVNLDLDDDRGTITAICQEVGGLPLAIELAAACTAVMTPSQILDRLGDRLSMLRGGRGGPEHHRTIEATIAWSYDLLDDDTQRLLRFLSMFEGGFDLEQAESVGGDDAVDRLTDLVRKNLVHRNNDRFGMQEAVRQYAAARLKDRNEEDEARRRHFEYFAAKADEMYSRPDPRSTIEELEWMTSNLANLRLAVNRGAGNEVVKSATIAATLWQHHIHVMFHRWDGNNVYEPLLPHLDDLDPELRMAVLHGAGTIAWIVDRELERASELLEHEYNIHRETGLVPRTSLDPLVNLAILRLFRGDEEASEELFEEGIEASRAERRPHHILSANYAMHLWHKHGVSRALETIREAQEFDHLATPLTLAIVRLDEAELVNETGDHATARQLLDKSLSYFRHQATRFDQQSWALTHLAQIEHEQGDHKRASTLLLEAIELEATYGLTPIWHHESANTLARVLIGLGRPQVALRVLAEFEGNALFGWAIYRTQAAKLRAALEAELSEPSGRDDEVPLIDAVRQALEAATR